MSIISRGGNFAPPPIVQSERAAELREWSRQGYSIMLNRRQLCDLELLSIGAFAPLHGFMGQADYERVLAEERLADGSLWPIPVVLAVSETSAAQIDCGDYVALRDSEGFMPAVLRVADLWKPDREWEAETVYGTRSRDHPGVRLVLDETASVYVGGTIEVLELPVHYDFESLWHTPARLRQGFDEAGWDSVIAFQTSRPMHRLQRDLVVEMAAAQDAKILLHPVVGESKPGDLEYYARVHCYQALLRHLPAQLAVLSLLPLAMRMAGPREALWHGIIHRNYGCSAFIVGPDDSSPPSTDNGTRFYGKYAAQEHVAAVGDELNIQMLAVEERRYCVSSKTFLPVSVLEQNGDRSVSYSDHELRQALAKGEPVPDWFSFPEVIDCLSGVYPSHSQVGITLFFTGLSGSGKSTLAGIMRAKLIENGQRPVTLLDGDIVRQNLSSELGFSRAHRDLNIRRIGFVANEISKNGGVAICAPIAPYRTIRREIRGLIEQHGVFIEIYLSTPLAVCEERDRKGLYAKARAGEIPQFTGISDPYESPERAELVIDTSKATPTQACRQILDHLTGRGLVDVRRK